MPTYEETENLIIDALRKLICEDGHLIKKELKEECINHRLAVYLEEGVKNRNFDRELKIDIEYNKNIDAPKENSNGKKMRPDIVIHKRGNNTPNMLAIEAKKDYTSKHDKHKIHELLVNDEYAYSYGCLISYFPKRDYLKYILIERRSILDIIGSSNENLLPSTRYWKKLEKYVREESSSAPNCHSPRNELQVNRER